MDSLFSYSTPRSLKNELYSPKHHPQPCRDYCCSRFVRFKSETIETLRDLETPIHPIFRRKNFSTSIDYSSLEPSLRLASRLLESPALVEYINAVVDGEVKNFKGEVIDVRNIDSHTFWTQLPSTWPKPNQDNSSKRARKRSRRILRQLAEMIEFDVCPSDDNTTGFSAVCQPNLGPSTAYATRCFPNGCRSRIRFNEESLNTLKDATAKYNLYRWIDQGWEDDCTLLEDVAKAAVELLTTRFLFATENVHEMSHSMQFAVIGRTAVPMDLFHRGNKVAEAGFEMEAELFGGVLSRSPAIHARDYLYACDYGKQHRVSSVISFHSWPSFTTAQAYSEVHGYDICPFSTARNYDLEWIVPAEFMNNLFSNDFWAQQEKKKDLKALHPPTESSWPFSLSFDQRLEPIPFSHLEYWLGTRRALNLCSPLLIDDDVWGEHTTKDWIDHLEPPLSEDFEEPLAYSMSRTQYKKMRRAARKAVRFSKTNLSIMKQVRDSI